MRTNGFLWYAVDVEGSGLDEDGEPIAGNTEWSDPIPCLIQFVTNTNAAYGDGTYKQVSYKVVAEALPLDATLLKLERDSQYLGEFAVLGKPNKTTMDRTIIYV